MRKKETLALILVFILSIIFPLTINASDYQVNPENYKSGGPSANDVKDMYRFGGSIAGVVQIVGTIVSIGTMVIIGIRYIVASADEKAEYKERMLPYVIGCVLLFGSSNIVNILYNVSNNKIEHFSEEWISSGGKMYEIKCNNMVSRGPIQGACGKEISIPVPEDHDVKCSSCGALLYKAYADEPTAKARVLKIETVSER